ncbi:MAG: hypothetical protein ACRDTF_21900 [Pseudonocardiaceae bacterium]
MIDIDSLWRMLILLAAAGVLPLLLALGWVARRVADSCTAVLLRSWWRGHRRRFRRRHRRHASTPVGPELARHAVRRRYPRCTP